MWRLFLKMNKKGYIGEGIVNLWAILLIVLLIVGFFFIFNVGNISKKGVKQMIESDRVSENNKLLINFLRTDVFVDEEKMNFADLIAISYLSYDYEILRIKTIEFMEKNELCFDLIVHLFDLPGGELATAMETGFEMQQEIKIKNICSRGFFGIRQDIKPSYTYVPVLSQLVQVELILYE